MDSALALLTIEIGIDPVIREFGGLVLTWHGIFTAVGIAAGVFVAVIVGRRLGFLEDDVYSVALIAIPCGIIGARALYVLERWSRFSSDPVDILRLNEGGISIYGAILGGLVGGLAYVWMRKLPIRRALDVMPFGAMLGMAVGRIGDLINGEHFGVSADLPWSFVYTHVNSPSFGRAPQHPAIAYEMMWDLMLVGLLIWLTGKLRPPGMVFVLFLGLYAVGRFTIQFYRLDAVYFAGLQEAHLLALGIMAVAVPVLVARARWGSAPVAPSPAPRSRRRRRR